MPDGLIGEQEQPVREPGETDSDAVVVAYVYSPTSLTYSWHHSMIELIGWDLAHEGRIIRGGYLAMRYGTDGLSLGRNKAVLEFLNEKVADWLFWVDTDMGFPADTVDRLLEAADPVERPIVGALAFSQREELDDGMGGFRCRATPTIFDWTTVGEQMGFAVRFHYQSNTLTRCGGTGSACILIHRSVFEKIHEKYGRAWYDRVPNTTTGQILSEDLAFCLRAGTLGIPVYVHTGIKTTHYKNLWLAEDDYLGQMALDQYQANMVPPATQRTAVIVPAMRPKCAAEFIESFAASTDTGLATIYVVHDSEDAELLMAWTRGTRSYPEDSPANVVHIVDDDARTFAERVNLGYRHTDEPWVFIVGEDVRFQPRWLDQAQTVGGDTYGVVGTNDLGNPRVLRGEHAVHLLIRRSYIDDVGASWDGPGVLAHEGYRHWFVDDEIVTAAKQRGQWTMAPHSIVEHLHPLWGKGADDAVYQLGRDVAEGDKAEFLARLEANALTSVG